MSKDLISVHSLTTNKELNVQVKKTRTKQKTLLLTTICMEKGELKILGVKCIATVINNSKRCWFSVVVSARLKNAKLAVKAKACLGLFIAYMTSHLDE